MTEHSMLWVTGDVGDGSDGYNQTETTRMFAALLNNGVLKGYLNDLAVTGTGSPISMAAGGYWLQGIFYHCDAAVALSIATPGAGSTGFQVVIRADSNGEAKQTVTAPLHDATGKFTARVIVLTNIPGTATIPAAEQTGGVWDETLATGTIASGGVVTLTDVRTYCVPNVQITPAKIANRTRQLIVQPASLYMGSGLDQATITPLLFTPFKIDGVKTCTIEDSLFGASILFSVPNDYASGLTVKALINNENGSNVNIRASASCKYAAVGEIGFASIVHSASFAENTVALGSGLLCAICSTSLSSATAGDVVSFYFARDSSNALDTGGHTTIYFLGFLVEYTADS